MLVFFRGGWCPACTRHPGELIKVYPELQRRGVQLVALSAGSSGKIVYAHSDANYLKRLDTQVILKNLP